MFVYTVYSVHKLASPKTVKVTQQLPLATVFMDSVY